MLGIGESNVETHRARAAGHGVLVTTEIVALHGLRGLVGASSVHSLALLLGTVRVVRESW